MTETTRQQLAELTELLGENAGLEDVLMELRESIEEPNDDRVYDVWYSIDDEGTIDILIEYKIDGQPRYESANYICKWIFKKPLSEQTLKTIQALHKILIK